MKSERHKHRSEKHDARRNRYKYHWQQMLYQQAGAYAIVLLLWMLPVPNPVKVLAVTFHELSHAIAAIATGGSVFGFAIAPNGAGVTFGIGGNFFLILIAGYLGSGLWGALLYAASVRWRAQSCLIALEIFVLFTAFFGWLNDFTAVFGLASIALMTALFWMPEGIQVFFVRLVGSACCCYAPLEIAGELFRLGRAPQVMGHQTASDVDQLATLLNLPAALVVAVLLAFQFGLLYGVVRWTCRVGAKRALRSEGGEKKAIREQLKELRRFTRVGNTFRR